jgi:hypothetical protein
MSDFWHIHHLSSSFLKNFFASYQPIFVLNTGRSGSAFVDSMLRHASDVQSYHEAPPNMFLQPNFAYHNQQKTEVLQKMVEVARVELMLEAALKNKIYVESNQCLVFFVHQIKQLFPKARFVHLTRHPGTFVTSALQKGWHKNDSVWEKGRIRMKEETEWQTFTQIEKLGWVWTHTHQFIEEFKKQHRHSFLSLKLEDLTADGATVNLFLEFIGSAHRFDAKSIMPILERKVNRVQISREPANMFKRNDVPKYEAWTEQEKAQLRSQTETLASQMGYIL